MIDHPPGSTTFDVKVYGITKIESTVKGRPATYRLRWQVRGRPQRNTANFQRKPLAEARAGELRTAMSKGVAFHVESGLPVTELAALAAAEAAKAEEALLAATWFEFASDFVRMKWPDSSPGRRRNLAKILASATPALYTSKVGRPDAALLREAMYSWALVPGRRYRTDPGGDDVENDPPEHLASALEWLASNTHRVADIDATLARGASALVSRKVDGGTSAASTIISHRYLLRAALDYAVERKLLDANPLHEVKLSRPRTARQVDKRSVINHRQARAFLAAVGTVSDGRYKRLVVFFGCMYYSGLRPEEVREVTEVDVTLPDGEDEWGEFLLSRADPQDSDWWTDEDEGPSRGLKSRAEGDTRPVPIPTPLVRIIREHVKEFGWGPEGHLVRGVRGGPVSGSTYHRAFHRARTAAFSPQQCASPLAGRPYDLRHACLSGWLNAGVPPTQVAQWAGHTLQMLLTVYAKCVEGQEDVARRRIDEALREGEEGEGDGA